MTKLKLKHGNEFRDRHGRVRRYFRRPGCKSVSLPGLPGSAEFMAAYQAALTGTAQSPKQIGENANDCRHFECNCRGVFGLLAEFNFSLQEPRCRDATNSEEYPRKFPRAARRQTCLPHAA